MLKQFSALQRYAGRESACGKANRENACGKAGRESAGKCGMNLMLQRAERGVLPSLHVRQAVYKVKAAGSDQRLSLSAAYKFFKHLKRLHDRGGPDIVA